MKVLGIYIQHLNLITASIRVNTAASFIKETDRKHSLTTNKHLFLIPFTGAPTESVCLACSYAVNWEKKHFWIWEDRGILKPLSRAESKPALIIHPMNKIFVKRRGNNRLVVKIGQAQECCTSPQMNQPLSIKAHRICKIQRRLWCKINSTNLNTAHNNYAT